MTPDDTSITSAAFTSLAYVSENLGTCIASCPYAYKIKTDGINASAKVCVASCGTDDFLTKDSNDVWVCQSACKDAGIFYFTNSNGDKECLPLSNETDGCKIPTSTTKNTADSPNPNERVYHNDVSTMRECVKACAGGYYLSSNLKC
jgi:hypothetical protein